MELKKNPNLELSKYSTLFFNIGLSISIGLVIVAFEWKTESVSSTVRLEENYSLYEDIIDIPVTNQTPAAPPKMNQPMIIEIPDEEEIEEVIDIDLDIDMMEETVIEELVTIATPEEEIADEVFSIAEVMPAFPGGNSEFKAYISQNLKYPRKALSANVEGKVIISFVVAEDGDISEIEILKGIGFGCDEEALRVLQLSPNWTPGQQQGKNVKVRMMVPLTFDI
jgi:protein TonB